MLNVISLLHFFIELTYYIASRLETLRHQIVGPKCLRSKVSWYRLLAVH